jgi:hypothetical protein
MQQRHQAKVIIRALQGALTQGDGGIAHQQLQDA